MRAMTALLLGVLWLGCSDANVEPGSEVVEVEQEVEIEKVTRVVESEPVEEAEVLEELEEPDERGPEEPEVPPVDVVWSKFIDHRLRIEEILESGEFIYLPQLEAVAKELLQMRKLERELAISARQISDVVGLRISRALAGLENRLKWATSAASQMQSPPVLRQALQEFDYWLYQMEDFFPEGTLKRSIADHITIEQIVREGG